MSDLRSVSTLDEAISRFGSAATAKLANKAATGAPEDQLRAPLEALFASLAQLGGFPPASVVAVGESSLAELKTRPDYAITAHNALVGFVKVKAPGKGADPRRFTDPHDREQWEKLKSLPNLIYTDGNTFSLWRDGQLVEEIIRLEGDIETAGAALVAGAQNPAKHVISVAPGTTVSMEVEADAPGAWVFHCHLAYHMDAGMMRTVIVEGGPEAGPATLGHTHGG